MVFYFTQRLYDILTADMIIKGVSTLHVQLISRRIERPLKMSRRGSIAEFG